MWFALLTIAHAGYGDPVDGVPNYAEREAHLWTNAVRIRPQHFANDYGCPFGAFAESEQTGKIPLWWHSDLGVAARLHSEDMAEHGNLTHSSSDGTGMLARVGAVYSGYIIGENVANGYALPYQVVVNGWMCSSGHRQNIMDPDYEDLGTGVDGVFWTQDFGARGFDRTAFAARLGLHFPAFPTDEADYMLAVYTGDEDPAEVRVVVAGVPHTMSMTIGEDKSSGIYEVTAPHDEGCNPYWFEVETASGAVHQFPEDGAYGFGSCPWTDEEARWILRSEIPQEDQPEEEDEGCGCAQGGPGPIGTWLGVGALLGLRRRT